MSLASSHNAYECMVCQVGFGANVNYLSKNENTALMNAAYFNRIDIATFLIEQGANIAHRSAKTGFSTLDYAMPENKKGSMVWIEFFNAHRDKLDAKDLELFHEHRLNNLFAQGIR